jgi:drug/metabolite transporter (DMT)-like permease
MDNTLLIAILAGLGGMVGWGAADFFAKKTIDEIGDLKTLFWGQALGILPLAIAFLVQPKVPSLQGFDPLFILLFGIASALSYLPLYAGFGKGQVSLLSPIFASYSVVVVILAAIFLDASVTGGQWVAIVLVFIGILLLSTDPRELLQSLKVKRERGRGVPQVLTAMLIYSVWLLFFDKFLNGKEWLFYLLIIRCVSALTLLGYSLITRQSLSVRQNRGLWKYLLLIGLFDIGAFSAVSYGFSHTDHIGIVTVLSATFSLVTIVLAYAFLKERINRLQAAAAALIICGIVVISLG